MQGERSNIELLDVVEFVLSEGTYVRLLYVTSREGPDFPVTLLGKIPVFQNFSAVPSIIESSGIILPSGCESPNKIALSIDIALALDTVLRSERDEGCFVLNAINLLYDLLNVFEDLRLLMPREFKNALDELANFLTFDKEIGCFFRTAQFSREFTAQALIWVVGAVLTRLTYFVT